jgi:hypothetical protein
MLKYHNIISGLSLPELVPHVFDFYPSVGINNSVNMNDNIIIVYELNNDPTDVSFKLIMEGSVLDTLSSLIKDKLNNGSAHIVIDTASETLGPVYNGDFDSWETINLHEIFTAAALRNDIRPTSITWLTGDLHAERLNSVNSINIKSHCLFFSLVVTESPTGLIKSDFDHVCDFDSIAISPNRHISCSRAYIVSSLFQRIQEGKLSTLQYSFPKSLHGKTIIDAYCDILVRNEHTSFNKLNLIDWNTLNNNILQLYYNAPMLLDVDPTNNTCAEMDAFLSLKPYYQRSVFSIVTESNAEGGKCFISEAIVIAILMRTPFLVVGNRGTLVQLRKMGFKTFRHMFDESYDNEEDDISRYHMILDQVDVYGECELSDAIDIRNEMKELLEYNFNHLFTVASNDEININNWLTSVFPSS